MTAKIEVRSPATGELLGTVAASSPARSRLLSIPLRRRFGYGEVPLLERVELCRAAFEICMERSDEIAEMITREVGKTIRESREEMVEYGRPFPARVRGRPPLRGQGSSLDAGADGRQADRRRPGGLWESWPR